jgi:transposase-like protein
MENILTAMARQFLPQMEPEERAEALRSLKRMIDEEFFAMAVAESGDETARYMECPRCGSDHVVKRGLDGRGEQRFLCRRCSRTFTARTNRVFATTKLDRATWMKFAECHVDVLTLRESAERCGVSLKTAFFMRHRVLECIAQSMPAFRSAAGDGMEIDECYLRESFKGNRKNAACGIPRKAHHRPEGIDHYEQICVLTGINDAGDFFFEMTGRGAMSGEQAARFLEGKVASGTIVATDKAHAYRESLMAPRPVSQSSKVWLPLMSATPWVLVVNLNRHFGESPQSVGNAMIEPIEGVKTNPIRLLFAARMLGRPYAFREGDYAKAVIATVPTTMSKRPREVLRDSRSPRTSHANAIEATIESLSTCTTTLTTPVCSA